MRRMLLIVMALVLIAIPAAGQGGFLGIYSDEIGENCTIADTEFGQLKVYVVHMESPGATAVEFAVDFSGVPELLRTEDTTIVGFVTLGNSLDGVSIGYGACLTSPVTVLELNFIGQGNSAPCSELRLLPHPDNGQSIQMVDCDVNLVPIEGRGLFVNPTDDCDDCTLVPVATEIDTWGSLKSLYR